MSKRSIKIQSKIKNFMFLLLINDDKIIQMKYKTKLMIWQIYCRNQLTSIFYSLDVKLNKFLYNQLFFKFRTKIFSYT